MKINFETSDINQEITEFIYQKNNESGSFCHLCPQKMDEIQKELDRILKQKTPGVLVLRDEKGIIQGVFRLYTIPEEQYMELDWAFVREETIYDTFFAYLRSTYAGFHLDAIVTKSNQVMFEAYQKQGLQYEEEQILMTLEDYTPKHVDAQIVKYAPEYEVSYRAIHDDVGLYWTAERMLKALDRFDVFIAVENGETVGYIEMTTHDDENEPMQLFVKENCRGKGYGRALLQTAIENNMPRKMVLEVFANNAPALNLYLSLGFKEKLREYMGSMIV